MGQGFDGGTDLQAPLERAIARVQQAGWQAADLLIVSDGEFGCVRATLDALDDARAPRSGCACRACWSATARPWACSRSATHIHWVRDWRRHDGRQPGGGDRPGFSPVHSKSLTALYFPERAVAARGAPASARRRARPGAASAAQVVALAELDAGVAQQRVGGRDVEEEVGQRELAQVVLAVAAAADRGCAAGSRSRAPRCRRSAPPAPSRT